MTVKLMIPMLGMGMTEGTLAEWLVADGAQVEEGMAIYSIENDKSIQEVESPANGTLKITALAGETYDVGAVIGEIV